MQFKLAEDDVYMCSYPRAHYTYIAWLPPCELQSTCTSLQLKLPLGKAFTSTPLLTLSPVSTATVTIIATKWYLG